MPDVPSTMVLCELISDSTPMAWVSSLIGLVVRWSLASRTGTVLMDFTSAVVSVMPAG